MRSKEVDNYIESVAEFAKPVLRHFRDMVHSVCPDVQEVIKWRFPCFDYKGLMCGMAAHKEHCSITLWKGTIMEDPDGILEVVGKTGMGTFGKIKTMDDLPKDDILAKYVRQAVDIQDQGLKIPSKTASQKTVRIPVVLQEALNKNAEAKKVFESFSYSNKKEYTEWIDSAKTENTRTRRLVQAIEWIAEGKPRNWKYMR